MPAGFNLKNCLHTCKLCLPSQSRKSQLVTLIKRESVTTPPGESVGQKSLFPGHFQGKKALNSFPAPVAAIHFWIVADSPPGGLSLAQNSRNVSQSLSKSQSVNTPGVSAATISNKHWPDGDVSESWFWNSTNLHSLFCTTCPKLKPKMLFMKRKMMKIPWMSPFWRTPSVWEMTLPS